MEDDVLSLISQIERDYGLTENEKSSDKSEEEDVITRIVAYAKNFVFPIEDNRKKGGALWVYHDRDDTIHALNLKEMGMRYKAGRGWWIK